MTDKNTIFQTEFLKPVQKTGKATVLLAMVCMMFPGLYLMFFHGIFSNISHLKNFLWKLSMLILFQYFH